jgi:hypothetical protein
MDFLEFDEVTVEPVKIGTSFEYVELEEGRKIPQARDDCVTCPSCGAINPKRIDFCIQCQGEIVSFRPMELDKGPVKVLLKFSSKEDYRICPHCGAYNVKEDDFCKDCMSCLT